MNASDDFTASGLVWFRGLVYPHQALQTLPMTGMVFRFSRGSTEVLCGTKIMHDHHAGDFLNLGGCNIFGLCGVLENIRGIYSIYLTSQRPTLLGLYFVSPESRPSQTHEVFVYFLITGQNASMRTNLQHPQQVQAIVTHTIGPLETGPNQRAH